jgi:hypothetical protein
VGYSRWYSVVAPATFLVFSGIVLWWKILWYGSGLLDPPLADGGLYQDGEQM